MIYYYFKCLLPSNSKRIYKLKQLPNSIQVSFHFTYDGWIWMDDYRDGSGTLAVASKLLIINSSTCLQLDIPYIVMIDHH